MRQEQEVFISDLVHKHRYQLVEHGAALLRQGSGAQTARAGDPTMGKVIFSKLLDGCLLTISYSLSLEHQLRILDWRFTDPALN